MSLNIKNEHVHALAREAARVTGKSQTGAIEEALVNLLKARGTDPIQDDQERRIDLIRRISLKWESHPEVGDEAIREVEDLYDARTGMPA